MNDIFDDIGTPPSHEGAENAKKVARQAGEALIQKESDMGSVLSKAESGVSKEFAIVEARVSSLIQGNGSFALESIVDGWFPQKSMELPSLISAKVVPLNANSAANYGTISDSTVKMFVESAASKTTGEARNEVAKVLDAATGVAKNISEDKDLQNIEEKVQKVLEQIDNAKRLARVFDRMFGRMLNRVGNYQSRLLSLSRDLSEKSVQLDVVSASLRARREQVKDQLFDTCIYGMALERMILVEYDNMGVLEKEMLSLPAHQRGPLNENLKEQKALIQLSTKRLIDLKAFAVKLVGLYSVLGTVQNSISVVRADVEFTRTNLMAALGIQLGLVADVVSTLRVAKSTSDVREAEASASASLSATSGALEQASNKALLDVQTTMASLEATIGSAVRGIQNTQQNMLRIQEMQKDTEEKLNKLFTDLGQ